MKKSKIFLDSNLFLRSWEGDELAISYLAHIEAGVETYYIPSIVLAEVAWFLTSFYKIKKYEVEEVLEIISNTRNIKLASKHNPRYAIGYFNEYNIKFTDCLIASYMTPGDKIVTRDKEFEKIKFVKRIEF